MTPQVPASNQCLYNRSGSPFYWVFGIGQEGLICAMLQNSLGTIPLRTGCIIIAAVEIFQASVGIPSLIFSPEEQKDDRCAKMCCDEPLEMLHLPRVAPLSCFHQRCAVRG
ncbi:hypothetical protein MSG28_003781 [Choristoneura fumiferana]|uniref:Uncharacterized protein n=1 Tax=Choristoneura fumiferana TaxID=7141 RepID=A0ACC0KG77_CHOFU|nr:hypothetical protein MSG28_003781 [Choristoneura fumiferana]